MTALFQAKPPPTTIFFDFNTLQEASQSTNDWLLPYAVNARLQISDLGSTLGTAAIEPFWNGRDRRSGVQGPSLMAGKRQFEAQVAALDSLRDAPDQARIDPLRKALAG